MKNYNVHLYDDQIKFLEEFCSARSDEHMQVLVRRVIYNEMFRTGFEDIKDIVSKRSTTLPGEEIAAAIWSLEIKEERYEAITDVLNNAARRKGQSSTKNGLTKIFFQEWKENYGNLEKPKVEKVNKASEVLAHWVEAHE